MWRTVYQTIHALHLGWIVRYCFGELSGMDYQRRWSSVRKD